MAYVHLDNKEIIKKRLGIEVNGEAQRYFTNECYRRMDKYVPKKTGNLRTIVDVRINDITYEMPYAEKQYFTLFSNYTTPGTGPYWDKKMVSAEGDLLVKDMEKFIDRRLK